MLLNIRSRIRAFWQKWLRSSPGRSIRVDCYTRDGCCLCDDALKIIKGAGWSYALELHVIDVDRESELEQQYGDRVPVVLVNGRERFHGRVNPVLFERLLWAETNQG
jgi:glutaredoxin